MCMKSATDLGELYLALDLFHRYNFPLTFSGCPVTKTAQLNDILQRTQIMGLKQKCLQPGFKHQVLSSQNNWCRIIKTRIQLHFHPLFCCPSERFSEVRELPSFCSALVGFRLPLGSVAATTKCCAAAAGSFPLPSACLKVIFLRAEAY